MSLIIPSYPSIYCAGNYCVRYSYFLIAIIPLLIVMVWLTKKNFVKFNNRMELDTYIKSKKIDRKFVLILRSFAFVFLMAALASPFMLENRIVQGNPRLTILVDNSTSMNLYDASVAYSLFEKLEGTIPVNIRTIAAGEHSTIGNGILNNIEGNDNVLVISDGVNNEGKLLGDIMLLAAGINTSVSTISLTALNTDAGVTIQGPPELIEDSEGDFMVRVDVVGKDIPYTLEVIADDQRLIFREKGTRSTAIPFTRKFTGDSEYHTLTARLVDVGENDYFGNNNEYFKSVKIVKRPKVLFVTERNSPLAPELSDLYELDVRSSLGVDIEDYMAVIINDIHATKIMPHITRLTDYVSDGNGLVFIGGESSYDRGGYRGTQLESLLPVRIGAGEEEDKSDINIVIVIDISGGTEDYVAVEKAMALSVLDSLSEKNNVGAVAFNSQAYQIAGIKPLGDHKSELKEKISRLKFDGQSLFNLGIEGAFRMLSTVGGSKNIIFISDGKTTYQKLRDDTLDTVRTVNAKGVKVYTIGVGTETDSLQEDHTLFLGNMAALGEGIFYKVDASNRLSVEFGDKDDGKGEEFYNTLIPIDTTHFITLALDDIDATISGYNYAVPKPAARALVTTHKNIPILVIWRFGLGRVVSLSTDDGLRWAGELLNKKNSKLITKSINWAIGDLSRTKSYDVTIRDTDIGRTTRVNVISNDMPQGKDLSFAKIDTNLYSAVYHPDRTGYKELLGATFAVNYNSEYEDLGVNREFTNLVENTGGEIFDPADVERILEFVRAKSKRIKIDSTDYRWPFAIIAMLLFLAEIAIRRHRENLK